MTKTTLKFVRTTGLDHVYHVVLGLVFAGAFLYLATRMYVAAENALTGVAVVALTVLFSLAFVVYMLKKMALLPAATVTVDGERVKVSTPLLRGAGTKGELLAGQPLELSGGVAPASRNRRFAYVLSQGDARASFGGPRPLRDDTVEELRSALSESGTVLTVTIDNSELVP